MGKYTVSCGENARFELIYFGDIAEFDDYLERKYGADELEKLYTGNKNSVVLSVVYYPDINEFRGNVSIQMVMKYYQ